MNTTLAVVTSAIIVLITALIIVTIFSGSTEVPKQYAKNCSIMVPRMVCNNYHFDVISVWDNSQYTNHSNSTIGTMLKQTMNITEFNNSPFSSFAFNGTLTKSRLDCEELKSANYTSEGLHITCDRGIFDDTLSFITIENVSDSLDYVGVTVQPIKCLDYLQVFENKTGYSPENGVCIT